MFPAIRTTFAVSMIGLGLIALAVPAHAQSNNFRGKSIVAPKAERSESPSRFQRISIPKAEREQPRRIDVVSRGNQRFNAPKAERPSRQEFQAPKAERFEPSRVSQQRFQAPKAERFEPSRVSRQQFQAPKAERIQRAEAPVRRQFVERSEPVVKRAKFVASEEAVVRSEPKIVKAKAFREIAVEEKPAKVLKTKKQFVAKSEPKIVYIDSSDDEHGYYDDYGYYTDAGYSYNDYGYDSCQ